MSNLNFDNVPDKGAGFVQPGTIDIFKIAEVEVGAAKTGTPQIKVTFKTKGGDSLINFFAWTQKAAVNINHLVKNATGEKLTGDTTLEAVAAQLRGKKLAMKVTGRIATTNGRGYADLPFASFGAPADQKDSLVFTAGERAKIDAALAATGSPAAADTDGGAVAPTASDNDEF